MEAPILITGVYRTGSTLLTMILNQNPNVRISYDRANFYRFYLDRAGTIEERYQEILEEAQERFKTRWNAKVPVERIKLRIEEDKPITFAKVYKHFMLETFFEGQDNFRWGEKTLLQWSNIPLFLHMFPEGQALQIIRDPRSIVASQRQTTWEKPFRYLDAVFVCVHAMNWAKTVGSTLAKGAYTVVRYEDLVMDPESEIRRVCNFLGIGYLERMLDSRQFKDGDGKLWIPNTPFNDVESGISAHPRERWKSSLETWELLFVESILAEEMLYFGYEPSGVKFTSSDLSMIWERIRETPLIQDRLQRWLGTGEGVEEYASDPRDPRNWTKHQFR